MARGVGIPFGGSGVELKNKEDFRAILDAAPNEVAGLREALVAGNIDGSCYDGPCACLVGTLERVRKCEANQIVKRDSSRPAEVMFTGIRPGMTPLNSPLVAIVVNWIDEWRAQKNGAQA